MKEALSGADLVFLTAGMGGGTGTGAIAVAGEIAQSIGLVELLLLQREPLEQGLQALCLAGELLGCRRALLAN